MKVAILGSATVGRTLAGKIQSLGHDVAVGTRDVSGLLARRETGPMGLEPFSDWHAQHTQIRIAEFSDATRDAEIVFNCVNGAGALAALQAAGAEHLGGKILVDVSNPLDFSRGFPPTLLVANDDSLGEQIQRRFPEARVVKTLNTVNSAVMIDPGALAGGDHHLFVSGNDEDAKAQVTQILKDWFGWHNVIDLGDITTARGVEMYLPLWVRLLSVIGRRPFNIKVVT